MTRRLNCSPRIAIPLDVARGFTLIELMVSIAVIAVLATISQPDFSSLIASQRAKAVASELFALLSRTRSEAIARNVDVTLSPKSSAWANGWQVLDPSNAVLDDRGAVSGASITGPATVVYRPSGRIQTASAGSFVITITSGSRTFYQCVSVDLGGRPYMKAASSC